MINTSIHILLDVCIDREHININIQKIRLPENGGLPERHGGNCNGRDDNIYVDIYMIVNNYFWKNMRVR